jgi:hypothetical protein
MRTVVGSPRPAKVSVPLVILAIAAIVLGAAAGGYLVTTFLFAFSGGQNRMVVVVNLGALIVVALDILVAAATWILRSPADAIKWTAIAAGAGWAAALIAEWVLSFWLGAP